MTKQKLRLFENIDFYRLLEESGTVEEATGWNKTSPFPGHDLDNVKDSWPVNYEKSHSYGEYIFDWSWAQAYHKYGLNYYPKLTSMVPFTPVTAPHFIMPEWSDQKAYKMLQEQDIYYQSGPFSSGHYLFLEQREIDLFKECEYQIRHSIQYHFKNEGYESFNHYLSKLKSRKAKAIRNERKHDGLTIKQYHGDQLTQKHAKQMHQFYLNTIRKKNAIPYLNLSFFEKAFNQLKENILYIEVQDEFNASIAGSFFLYDEQRLYGRYWGCLRDIPNLHYEVCYYQGIEFCIENNIEIFEAGAQGEHKIARGFLPQTIYSAHKIKNKSFSQAIKNFIQEEKAHMGHIQKELRTYSPFKSL